MKPYYIKNFVNKKLLTWNDVDVLLYTSRQENVETINQEQLKESIKLKEKKNSIIISKAKHYSKDFNTVVEYLKLKDGLDINDWDIHVYISYQNGKSFKKHKDKAHNYIFQCEGKSRWIVEDSFDIVLEPGDLIYIPFEWYHQCIPMGPRVSASLPIWG